jgi:O-antigen/teichoic acid export membrane protein
LERTRLRANVVFNMVGMSVPIAVSLVTVPPYLAHIGAERFGLLSLIWLLLGYFGLADFGLSRAAANALARLAGGSPGERGPVLLTALYANILFGTIAGTILYLAGGVLIDRQVTLPDSLRAEVADAIPWIAGMVPLTLVGGIARAALESREKFLIVNLLELTWIVPSQVLPLLAAIWIGPQLSVLLPQVFIARLVAASVSLVVVARMERAEAYIVFDIRCLRELLGFGAWVSVSSVIDPILGSIDQLMIKSALGLAAVAHYAVPMGIVGRSQIVVQALARALFPRFSRLDGQEAKSLAESIVTTLAYVFGGICAAVLILGGPFMSLWVGPAFGAPMTPVIQNLMIGAWANGIAFIPYTLLQGQRRPGLIAIAHICELGPFALLLWLLINWLGVSGAAVAWTIRAMADALVLLLLCRIRMGSIARLLPPFALMLTAFAIGQITVSDIWKLFFAAAMIPLFVAFGVLFDATSRGLFLHLLGKLSASRESAVSP